MKGNDFSNHVALVLEDALKAYHELAETLPVFLASPVDNKYDADIMKVYRSVGVTVSRTLSMANRNIDDMRVAGILPSQDVLAAQPLLRMMSESFFLLSMCRSRDEMKRAPLVDPALIERMTQHQSVVAFRKTYTASLRA